MKKAFAIFLSLLLLASSSGITYAQHFCSGEEIASEFTFGEKFLSCGMEVNMETSCDSGKVMNGDSCCLNHFTTIDTDENFAKASFDKSFNKVVSASPISEFTFHEVEQASFQKIFFADYTPPPREQDLNILYLNFRI